MSCLEICSNKEQNDDEVEEEEEISMADMYFNKVSCELEFVNMALTRRHRKLVQTAHFNDKIIRNDKQLNQKSIFKKYCNNNCIKL